MLGIKVITAADVATYKNLPDQKLVAKFNGVVETQLEKDDEFILHLNFIEFGSDPSRLKFIEDAGYSLDKDDVFDMWIVKPLVYIPYKP